MEFIMVSIHFPEQCIICKKQTTGLHLKTYGGVICNLCINEIDKLCETIKEGDD